MWRLKNLKWMARRWWNDWQWVDFDCAGRWLVGRTLNRNKWIQSYRESPTLFVHCVFRNDANVEVHVTSTNGRISFICCPVNYFSPSRTQRTIRAFMCQRNCRNNFSKISENREIERNRADGRRNTSLLISVFVALFSLNGFVCAPVGSETDPLIPTWSVSPEEKNWTKKRLCGWPQRDWLLAQPRAIFWYNGSSILLPKPVNFVSLQVQVSCSLLIFVFKSFWWGRPPLWGLRESIIMATPIVDYYGHNVNWSRLTLLCFE